MALKPCKECGREISTEAKVCPHCGKQFPTGKPTSPVAMGCLVLLGLAVVGSLLSSLGSNPSTSTTPASDVPSTGATTESAPPSVPTESAPPPLGSQWHYSHDADEMTGKLTHTAGVSSTNTVEFDFPYQGAQHARLLIRRHPRYGRDVIFAIERGQLLCPSYDGCSVLVRFDDAAPTSFSASPAADHSSETIFLQGYDRFVAKLRAAKTVRISPKVYQQGTVVFTFDVSGFDPKALSGQ